MAGVGGTGLGWMVEGRKGAEWWGRRGMGRKGGRVVADGEWGESRKGLGVGRWG